jgi:hypothetical protein
MGIDYHTYVGPYIQVHNPKRKTTEEYPTCSNEKCAKHKKHSYGDKFCPDCGSEIRSISFPCVAPLDFDVYEEFNDRLTKYFFECCPDEVEDFLCFAGNVNGSPGKSFYPKQEVYILEVSPSNIPKEIAALEEMYKEEINRLKAVFGNDAVQIKWGVLGSAS